MEGIALQVEEMVGSDDQEQGDGGDGDFADGAYEERAAALFEQVLEIGAQAYSGEG